jgi:hypothetical protein
MEEINRHNSCEVMSHEDKTRITKLEMKMESQSEKTFRIEVELEKIKEDLIKVDDKVDRTNVLIKDEILEIKEQFTDIRVNMLERFASIENQLSTTVTKTGMITAGLLIAINLIVPIVTNLLSQNYNSVQHSIRK